jgi:histone H3/H4
MSTVRVKRSELSRQARKRLSKLGDKAAERAVEEAPEEIADQAEAIAHDIVETDSVIREAVSISADLDQAVSARRESIREEDIDPFTDPVFESFRSAREPTREAIENRLSELVGEAVEYAVEHSDGGER